MSLIDLILGQKGILISLGLAFLLLFVALLLGATGRLRASSAKRKRRKAKQAAMVAAQVTQLDQSSQANAPITAKAHVQPISDITPTPSHTPTPSQVASTAGAVKATPVTSTVVTAPPEGQVEGQLSGAMQDILSSVFVDEDAVARYEVLLRDLDNIEISDLLTLCQQVTRQLGAGMMPTANKEQ